MDSDTLALLQTLAWPAVVLIALAILADPLRQFVATLGPRLGSISLAGFSLQLATLSQVKPASLEAEIRALNPAPSAQSDTQKIYKLVTQLRAGGKCDFLVIDLGAESDPNWLTSRLFLLTYLIMPMDRPRCMVFVETRGGVDGIFIGIASTDRLRWALGRKYDWFETAIASAQVQISQGGALAFDSETGTLIEWQLQNLVQLFLQNIRKKPVADGSFEAKKWVARKDGEYEHARWIDRGRLKRILQGDLSTASILLEPNKFLDEYVKVVLRQSGRFVPFVDNNHVFLQMIDRQTVLEGLATDAASRYAAGA